MFYCEGCRREQMWPIAAHTSHGRCEVCRQVANCHDVPSEILGKFNDQRREDAERAEAIESIRQAHEED